MGGSLGMPSFANGGRCLDTAAGKLISSAKAKVIAGLASSQASKSSVS